MTPGRRITAGGRDETFSRPMPPGPRSRFVAAVLIFGTIVFALAGWLIYDYHEGLHAEATEILVATAADTSAELERWLANGSVDVAVTATQSGMAERYLRWKAGQDPAFPMALQNRLDSELELRHYDRIGMRLPDGTLIQSAPKGEWFTDPTVVDELCARSLEQGKPVFDDHIHDGGRWYVAWASPARANKDAEPVAVIVYAVRIGEPLRTALGGQVLPYEAGALVLVRPHDRGFDIVSSRSDFEPVTMPEGPELHAALAEDVKRDGSSVRIGPDEKGKQTLATAQGVPGTAWFTATRVSMSVVDRPVWRVGGLVLAAASLLVLVVVLVLIIWRRIQTERIREYDAYVRLREALAARDQFYSNMTHELRTPLQSVLGFTSVMLGGMAGPLNDEQQRQMTMIDDAAKRLLGMVEDVLVMGKLRVGSSRAVVSDFSTDDVYRYVCGLMKPLSERKGLACGLAERAETVPMRTDREMVERIVVNLVSNAIKFTDEGSIHLATYADGDDVIFEVTDTGRGIAPEQLDRVMEEFHQVVEPDGVKPVGTGLGLAISRRMAEDLGGTLTVASVVGQGSTFTLRIPRVHPNA